MKTPILPLPEPVATVPTRYGDLVFHAFTDASGQDHVAVISGEVRGCSDVLCRIHSECLTSEVLGSLKCDCRDQLDLALQRIAEEGGIVLYLRQEGRGIGLANKLRAYALQNEGADTVDANRLLGLEDDLRSYDFAAHVLNELGVQSVRLMTNNPAKISGLRAEGIAVNHEPHQAEADGQAQSYLDAKRDRMGHLLAL
ncbi:MAG: GTP cyclohydrolase II [Myxococcales bacterium]|nr:GTP cyclohydrolase II [Myxococcales bacterium]